jgi:signal transduction histidine kinase
VGFTSRYVRSVRRLLGSRLEVAFSAGLLLWGAAEAVLIPSDWPLATRLAFALAANAPLALRHRHPYAVTLWAVVVLQVDGLLTILPYLAVTPLEGVAVGVYAIAAYGPSRRRAVLALAATGALPLLFLWSEREVPVTVHDMLVFTIMQLLAISAGWAVRLHREKAERAAAQAQSAGAEQAEQLARGLAAERRRIARELHAIVTRDLRAIAQLAQRARTQLDGAREEALGALAAISGTTTAALDELRRLLHVLRADDDGERAAGGRVARAPSPAAAVADACGRGWRATLHERGGAPGRTAADLAAGRLVEELLADPGNGGQVTVLLRRGERGFALRLHGRGRLPAQLRDPARLAPARERARLHGGALRRRRTLRGWRIDVALPLRGEVSEAADGAPAVDLLAGAVALAALGVEQLGHPTGAIGWASGLALIVAPLLLLRSRAGFATACVLAVGGLWARAVLGWIPGGGASLVPVVVFAPYAAAAYARAEHLAVAGGLVAGGFSVAAIAWMPDRVWTDVPIVICVATLSWTAGWYARGSSLRAFGLRLDQLRRADAAPARLAAALDEERRRVARDLHDAVAHGMSLVGLLAGAARATVPRDVVAARAALGDLDGAIAATHVELARLLQALRAGETPEEGLASVEGLDAIVDDARRCGQSVAVHLERDALAQAPAGVRASVCRIVQEALTNARKHAAGAAVRVTVGVEDGGRALVIEIRNGRSPGAVGALDRGAQRGVEGMRERARLLDGTLVAAPCADGGFAVRASLPLAPDTIAGGDATPAFAGTAHDAPAAAAV